MEESSLKICIPFKLCSHLTQVKNDSILNGV